eukprot:2095809-Rhodomonas_salina.1
MLNPRPQTLHQDPKPSTRTVLPSSSSLSLYVTCVAHIANGATGYAMSVTHIANGAVSGQRGGLVPAPQPFRHHPRRRLCRSAALQIANA